MLKIQENINKSAGIILLLIGLLFYCNGDGQVLGLSATDAYETTAGVTYYGGHYDQKSKSWFIDNKNQCDRILSGEIPKNELNANLADGCDDDNGLQSIDSLPLHNTVSFAELSLDPQKNDFSALGGLQRGTKLLIRYKDKCIVAEKLDVGSGGTQVLGYPRALDLWWQTARSLDFKNGFDTMSVKIVSPETPLTKLGETTACPSLPEDIVPPSSPTPITDTVVDSQSEENTVIQEETSGPSVVKFLVSLGIAALAIFLLYCTYRKYKRPDS